MKLIYYGVLKYRQDTGLDLLEKCQTMAEVLHQLKLPEVMGRCGNTHPYVLCPHYRDLKTRMMRGELAPHEFPVLWGSDVNTHTRLGKNVMYYDCHIESCKGDPLAPVTE
jgi:hypothetical protein